MAILLAISVAACSAAEGAQQFAYFEEQGGRVRDGANILSPATEAMLTEQLDRAEVNFGQQMAVVTVESLHGLAIEDFSLSYARAWELGDAERNDGLLLLVAPNERLVRIEVGTGLENTFPDPFCAEIIEQALVPAFRGGEFESGIIAGTERLIERMQQFPSLPANDNEQTGERAAG